MDPIKLKNDLLSEIDNLEFQLKSARTRISSLKKQLMEEESILIEVKLNLDAAKNRLKKFKMDHEDLEG